MPRRRNCVSIILASSGTNSPLSSMCGRRRMFFPGSCSENLFHLCQSEVTLFFAIVEMRRNTHARFGPVVNEDLTREKFAADFMGMRADDGNSSRTLCGIVRRVHKPAARFCSF